MSIVPRMLEGVNKHVPGLYGPRFAIFVIANAVRSPHQSVKLAFSTSTFVEDCNV